MIKALNLLFSHKQMENVGKKNTIFSDLEKVKIVQKIYRIIKKLTQ